jgi:hypothetical protein
MSDKNSDRKKGHRIGGSFFPDEKTLTNHMNAHDYMKFPNGKITLDVDGKNLSTILECLLKLHTALIREIGNDENDELTRKKAYEFAYDTEVAYTQIMDQLNLNRPAREDLN